MKKIVKVDRKTLIYLVLLFMASAGSIVWLSSGIVGPIISNDEMQYWELAQEFYQTLSYNPEQYNPLYPLLCSIFFVQGDLITAYKLMKIFNACVFSSIVFPVFFTSRLVIKEKYWWYLLTGAVIFFPWRIAANLIWAEPLYYALYAWGIFFFCCYLKEEENKILIVSGILSGLCFLAKQSGLLLIGSMGLTVLIWGFYEKKAIKNILIKALYFGVSAALCVVPLLIYKLFMDVGALGYRRETEYIIAHLFDLKDLFLTFMMNVSYYTLAGGFIILALVIYLVISMPKLDNFHKAFGINISISTFLIMILCSYHYINVKASYGRYLTVVIPFLYMLAIVVLENIEINKKVLVIISIVLLNITVIFNPFIQTMHAKGFFNQQDLSIWNLFFMKGALVYSAEDAQQLLGSPNANYYVMAGLFLFSLVMIRWIHSRIVQKISLTAFILMTICLAVPADNTAVKIMRVNGNETNSMYQYFVKEGVPADKIYKLSPTLGSIELEGIWFGKEEIKVADFMTLRYGNPMVLDFGGVDTPVADKAYAIKAPYAAEYYYDGIDIPIGLSEYQTTDGGDYTNIGFLYLDAGIEKNNGMEDAIYGISNNTVYIDKRKGKYTVNIKMNPEFVVDGWKWEYEVYANEKYAGKIDEKQTEIEFDVELKEDSAIVIEIRLVNGGRWQIAMMSITADGEEEIDTDDIYIIASQQEKKYDLPIVYENDTYVIYYQE